MSDSTMGDATETNARLSALVEAINAEPLLHASLGSKELFHSNMLEWFTTHQRDAATQVFRDWTEASPGTPWEPTQREWRHLDLVVHLAERTPLVIENKVFSPPRDEQLKEYTAEVIKTMAPHAPAFALLSLVAPGWPQSHTTFCDATWRHYSYGQLADSLDAAIENVPGGYERDTVAHYSIVIRTLQQIADLVNEAVTPDSDIRLSLAAAATLGKVRLDQGFEKLRTRTIAYRLADHLHACGFDGSRVEDGYMRRWPLLEWFTPVPGTSDELGWQLQERQWRLAVRFTDNHELHGRGEDLRARRAAYVSERYASWFDFSGTDGILAAGNGETGAFRRFDPDFVYLYRSAKTLTVAQLCALATNVAERAAALTNRPVG